MNSLAVLIAVRHKARTATELSRDLSISRTAIEEVVKDLQSLGWIVGSDGRGPGSGPGRPAKQYSFQPSVGHVAGIDIGVHSVSVRIANLLGESLGSARKAVRAEASVSERFEAVGDAAALAATEANLAWGDVWVAGVAAPGVIDSSGAVRRYAGDGMPGWPGLDVRAGLSELLGVPVLVESDSTMAVIAENWRGVAAGVEDVVFILSGNRTSAGLLLRGEPYRGSRGGAGLVGALPELGWSSAPDVLESLASRDIEPTREALFAAAERGNPTAVSVLDKFAGALAKGIAAMALAVDPELIVLGGGVSRGGPTILEPVRNKLREAIGGEPRLELSMLGSEATSIGAIRTALLQVDANLHRFGRLAAGFPAPQRVLGSID